ncbi:MAG TPA: amidohydrolase [Gemmatimonadota bacterium]|nr:amidohydrolase [Gemmatimonadota bacterium]
MPRSWTGLGALSLAAVLAAGCAAARSETRPGDDAASPDSIETRRALAGMAHGAWESTYTPLPSRPILIRGATIMTAAGDELAESDILLEDGRIAAIGANLDAPAGAEVVDGAGRFVTPGIIDTHSHLGVYPSPGVSAHSEGNEATDPTTAEVWAVHSVWPHDPGFTRALAGGVTTLQILPGSANLIGGRGVTLKLVPGRTAQEMMFPDAPMGLKMACGENPKRVYQSRGPSTRMGNWAGYRAAFIAAESYRDKWDDWVEDGGDMPDRDLANETLAEVLRGNVLVQNHCYRSDDMVNMINVAKEFDFRIRSFHHAVEAYKIRDYLARDSIGASVWVDWWGFKMEAWDMVPQNLGLLEEAGAVAVLHTDDPMGIQIMNQDAARAMHLARAAGIDVSRDRALRWITANPAWALGIHDRVGTLEVGKNADVVVWSGDPFSVYSHADLVYIDGARIYDRSRRALQPLTDFEVGILPARGPEGGAR